MIVDSPFPLPYFGSIAFYAQLYAKKEAFFSDNERYEKQTHRSRTKIFGANGPLNLTVPISRPNGKESMVFECEISYDEQWYKEHLKSIESAYRNTPYFIYYFKDISMILQSYPEFIGHLNWQLLNCMISKLGLSLSAKKNNEPVNSVDFEFIMNPSLDDFYKVPRYIQAFEEKHGFIGNLSILDLLFNEGPSSIMILEECAQINA